MLLLINWERYYKIYRTLIWKTQFKRILNHRSTTEGPKLFSSAANLGRDSPFGTKLLYVLYATSSLTKKKKKRKRKKKEKSSTDFQKNQEWSGNKKKKKKIHFIRPYQPKNKLSKTSIVYLYFDHSLHRARPSPSMPRLFDMVVRPYLRANFIKILWYHLHPGPLLRVCFGARKSYMEHGDHLFLGMNVAEEHRVH